MIGQLHFAARYNCIFDLLSLATSFLHIASSFKQRSVCLKFFFVFVFCQTCLIVACIMGVIAYRLAVYAAFASVMKDSSTSKIQLVGSLITPQLATSVTASCINFVIILILNFLYEHVAIWITDMGEQKLHCNFTQEIGVNV